jgi:hypothetical protein
MVLPESLRVGGMLYLTSMPRSPLSSARSFARAASQVAAEPQGRPLSTKLNRVGEPSLLVQNPDKFLDPLKRILISSTRIYNAIPVAPQ